jgi:hypothetical protein
MRSILALGLLITLCGAANAATVHHAHRHALVRPNQSMMMGPASGFAYGPAIRYRSAPDYEPYSGAYQGYSPGEHEQFLDSVRMGG